MRTNLARTTTYVDKDLLMEAKLLALRQGESVYSVLNSWIKAGAKMTGKDDILKKRAVKRFDDLVKVRPLDLKGKFSRREIYEWL